MIAGEFVIETFDYDGGRQVTVYVPPDQPEAIVFAGDSQMISRWGGLLDAADVPSTMIVGVHRAADQPQRQSDAEYRVVQVHRNVEQYEQQGATVDGTLCDSVDDAEDIMAETFVRALRVPHQFGRSL